MLVNQWNKLADSWSNVSLIFELFTGRFVTRRRTPSSEMQMTNIRKREQPELIHIRRWSSRCHQQLFMYLHQKSPKITCELRRQCVSIRTNSTRTDHTWPPLPSRIYLLMINRGGKNTTSGFSTNHTALTTPQSPFSPRTAPSVTTLFGSQSVDQTISRP